MKKTFKKLLSILMVFAMLIGMVPTQAFAFDYVDYSMEVALNGYSLGAKVADAYVSESSDSLAFCDFNDDNMFFSIFTEKDGEADWSSVVTEFEANKDYWLVVALTKQDGDSLLESELNPDNVTLEGGCVDKSAIYDDGLWWILFKLDRLADATPDVYTIAFDANGGNVSPESATTGSDGKLASLPTPTHTSPSASFAGWYTGKTGTIQVTTDTVFTSNTTIYAQWNTDYLIDVTLNGYEQGKAVADITFSENSDSVDIDTANCHIFTEKDGAPDWSSEVTEFEANKVYWLVVALTKQGGAELAESDLAASDVDLTNEYTEEQMVYDDGLWWISYKLKPLEASAPTLYNVWVAGTQVTSANASDVLGDGAASYNPTTNTLTVSDDITATGTTQHAIYAKTTDDFNVVVADGVTLSAVDGNGIYADEGSVNLKAKDVTIKAAEYAIHGYEDVTIDCGKFEATGDYGIYAYEGSVNLTAAGNVTIDARVYAIYGDEDVTIDCADLTITSDEYEGIYADYGSVNLKAGNVTISAENGVGIVAYGSAKLTVDGDVTIDAAGYAIHGYEYVTIDCADLTITSEDYDGIYADDGSVDLTAGNVTISAVNGYGICAYGSVNLTADGDVTIDAGVDGIYGYEDVTIDCADLTITSDEYHGIYASSGSVDLTAKDVSIEANYYAIYSTEDATIDCDTLNIISGLYGIYVYDGSIIIKNGTFDIQSTDESEDEADYYALHFTDGVQFPTDATVTAATEVDGDFEEYDIDKNTTYDHVKIGAVPAPVQPTVALNESAITLTVGGTATLVPTITPADLPNYALSWTSDDESVATVDYNGTVTAVAAGTATITVTLMPGAMPTSEDEPVLPTASCVVTVVPADVPQEPTTSVTVVKEWDAPEGTVLPESVEVYLLANGQEVTDSRVSLDAGNEWTYTWTELPVATEDGTPIVYTVDEVKVEGYEKTIGEAVETDTGIEIAITNTKDSGEDEEGGNGGGTTPTTPSAPSTPSVPDTSDNTNTLMYLAAMVASAAALVFVLEKKKYTEE